jgi:methionine aminotransferase
MRKQPQGHRTILWARPAAVAVSSAHAQLTPRPIASRLPHVGTTIFSVMSALAQQHGAINLSQGFPDFDAPAELLNLLDQATRAGHNQYAPMAGMPVLREAIAPRCSTLYGASTTWMPRSRSRQGPRRPSSRPWPPWCTRATRSSCSRPVYDSYAPSVELQGGKVVYATLTQPGYRPDWDEVEA